MQRKQEKKVNVDLYGGKPLFGGREKPLEADEIFCSSADDCQLLSAGKCACCRRAFDVTVCPYGRVVRTKGYTSRAKKYSEFRNRYRSDEVYAALDSPKDMFLRRAGGYVFLSLPHVSLDYIDASEKRTPGTGRRFIGANGKIEFGDPGFFSGMSTWIPAEELDVDALAFIARFEPRAVMGGVLREYQEKTVPALIDELRNFWPERYAEFEEKHPELCGKEVDYRGRTAKTLTLRQKSEIRCQSDVFVLDGDKLVCEDFSSALVGPFGSQAKHAHLVIPLDDSSTIKVEDNSWVVPGSTVFV